MDEQKKNGPPAQKLRPLLWGGGVQPPGSYAYVCVSLFELSKYSFLFHFSQNQIVMGTSHKG